MPLGHIRGNINIFKSGLRINTRSSDGVVVKLLACGARGPGLIPSLAAMISEIGYLLLQSRDREQRWPSG